MPGQDYTPEQITEALVALVACGGNAAETERSMQARAEKGQDVVVVPARTLRDWKNDVHSEQYRRLELTYSREVEDAIIAAARENAKLAGEAAREAIQLALTQLQNEPGKVKDPAQFALNLSKAMGVQVNEVLRLTGRPTDGQQAMDIPAILQSLESMGLRFHAPQLEPPIDAEHQELTG